MIVQIYSKEGCGYCDMAKTLLTSKNIPYTEQVLGIDFTREQLLANYSLAKTFPVIIVDGFYIGGYTNLVEHIEKNANAEVLVEVPTAAELDAIAVAAAVAVDQVDVDIAAQAADIVVIDEVAPEPATTKPTRKYSR